ncbi:MAG: DivIVA domain-containing protein [Clostridiales bacterium]|nr:DivIVA domain-containing protein [Clostridiales bacterium]
MKIMLPPHELKNKTFSRAMRGYNPVEVDEYIEFIIEKYTELYRENDELERKLKTAVTKLDEIKNDEDSIRSALIDAKRAAAQIKSEAEDRAQAIIRSAKSSCNTILSDFNDKIEAGRSTLIEMKRDTLQLKRELFDRYSEHIRYLDKLTEGIDPADIPEADTLRKQAVSELKSSIAAAYSSPSDNTTVNEPAASEPASTAETYEPQPSYSEPEETQNLDDTVVFSPSDVINENDTSSEDALIDNYLLDNAAQSTNNEPSNDTDTIVFDKIPSELNDDSEALSVNREPVPTSRHSMKDSIKELNKRYKEAEDVINTPDSDLDDDTNYLDFVKSVTGRSDDSDDSDKQADFDLIFNDSKKKK